MPAGPSRIVNPMLAVPDDDGGIELDTDMSAADMIEANESAMTEEELADLTYAFQAADMGGDGAIDVCEFSTMLRVMGCDITEEQAKHVIAEAKEGFTAWKKMADEENVAKCRRIWDQYDVDGSGTMDLKEVNLVIAKLTELGSTPEAISASDMEEGYLTFEEFSAWFLKQEGLPAEFVPPDQGATAGGLSKDKRKSLVKRMVKTAFLPLSVGTKVVMGPVDLLTNSARQLAAGMSGSTEEAEAMQAAAMEDDTKLIFAEFVFMMRAGMLRLFLQDDWQERAEDMRKLREAFDCADVDGNNRLELEELQMVIISMNPKVNIQPEDVERVWAVLNPDKRDWIPFDVFVDGMIKVKADPMLSKVIPMQVPNRFELLSLLIDSPINEDQEKLIFDNMTGLEKGGIRMLERMRKPMDPSGIRRVLEGACAGQLHYLTDTQRAAVNRTHLWCVLQACFIGMFFTLIPGMIENFLVYTLETDGIVDAYWTCPQTFGDPLDPEYANMSLPTLFDQDVHLSRNPHVCKAGLCVSIPQDVTEYWDLGGNAFLGGNWTDESPGPCWLEGLPPNTKRVCDHECSPLPQTFGHPDGRKKLMEWWIINLIGIVIGIAFELSLLMYTAVRSSVRISWALDLRLTPLNADRAFVANMLVRAAFEMGDPEGAVMGVESTKEAKANKPSFFRNVVSVVFIKGKVVLTGVLFKQITARAAPYHVATWMKPYSGTMLATMIWDTMMCHVVMKNAETRAFGVTTGVEVFNEIMDTYCPQFEADASTLSDKARIQMLRGIGVAIVKHGSMFPTMELLLRHAVNYLGMKKSKAVTSSGVIDDEVALLLDFAELSVDECRAVLSIHMLCYVLDGSVRVSELALWKKLLRRVEELYQVERTKFETLSASELRKYIVLKCPRMEKAVNRVPKPTQKSEKRNEWTAELEMQELQDLASFVPRPENITRFDQLVPRVICQQFRNNVPLSVQMLAACYDPEANKTFMARTLTPEQLSKFTFNETLFRLTSILTAQV